jgi:hypothetical protein
MATSGCSMGPSPARNKDDAKKQLDVMKGLVRQLKDENVRLRKKNELERAYFESCLTRMASIRGSLDGLTEEIPERRRLLPSRPACNQRRPRRRTAR